MADAGVVCSPPGNDNGTWALSGTTTMQIDGENLNIESYDCKKLVFVSTGTIIPGDILKFTMTRQ